MTAAAVSQSSSPRLPSPPPLTEVQIGPQSPSMGETFGGDADQLLGTSPADDGPMRRIRRGTKASEMSGGPPLIPLSQLDSPFQLQEHLKALYSHYTRPEGTDTVVPIQREVARQLAEPPDGVDRPLWLYELCRFLTMKVNNLIVAFFAESPPCSEQTCPEMRASEWQYLCAVHDPPKSCCAIDYCCHTLDWATNILTSPKHFPSRLTLGSESGGGPQAGLRHLTNIFRRLYRIFAHAWFQHRDVFWQVEGHDGLYIFFKTVCDMYHLIPEDNYTVPPEAEGEEAHQPRQVQEQVDGRRLTILRKESEPFLPPLDDVEPTSISTGATTRRHKSSASIGSRVTTISESAEDSEELTKLPSPEQNVPQFQPQSQPQPPPSAEDTNSAAPSTSVSQVTVAEVEPEDETSPASDPAPGAGGEEESQPAQTIDEEAPVTAPEDPQPATEAAKPETEPEAESKPEPGPEPESQSKPEPEPKPETNPEPNKLEEESAKEA